MAKILPVQLPPATPSVVLRTRGLGSKFSLLIFAVTLVLRIPEVRADSVGLAPGETVNAPQANLSFEFPQDAAQVTAFSAASVDGVLYAYVLSGLEENPYGGLTFVYEMQNTTVGGNLGISWLDVDGWTGVQTSVARGRNPYYYTLDNGLVRPGPFNRSASGETIEFSFPPGSEEPPVFAGENAYQLIVFTDATSWQITSARIGIDEFDPISGALIAGTSDVASLSTLSVGSSSAVPDQGSTLLLVTGSFVLMAAARRGIAR